jgi:hypothetical protein
MAKMTKIENIHVDSINGSKYAIGWSIGDARFHIWAEQRRGRRELEGTIFKNSTAQHGAPGHFDTRQLNPEHKTQAAILAEVLAVVDGDGVLAKAYQAERDRIRREQRRNELQHEIDAVEQKALDALRNPKFAADAYTFNQVCFRLYAERQVIADELAQLEEATR